MKIKPQNKYTDNSVLDVDFFREDIDEMYKDASKIDELSNIIYDDVKQMYLDKKHGNGFMLGGKGTLSYVSEQMKTLATLRTGKGNLLNQIVTNKLKISQLALNKSKNAADKDSMSTGEVARLFQQMFINNNVKTLSPSEQIASNAKTMDNLDIDKQLESRISKLQNEGKLEFSDNELAIKYEKDGFVFKLIMIDGKKEFVPVNKTTNEIIEDLPKTLYPKDTELNGKINHDKNIFISDSGNIYDII